MIATHYLQDNHPEAAFAYDAANRRMYLNNGAAVPVTGFRDGDGEEVAPEDLDLFDEVNVLFGPLSSGEWGLVCVRITPAH